MTRNWKKAARVLAPALLLPLWSCGDDKTTIIQGGSGELTTPDDPAGSAPVEYDLGSEILEFVHRVGRTDCPQLVGEILLTNKSQQRMDYRLRGGGADIKPLDLPTTEGTIDPGETRRIKVFFDCSQATSFTEILTFDLRNEFSGKTDVATVTVIGTIRLV